MTGTKNNTIHTMSNSAEHTNSTRKFNNHGTNYSSSSTRSTPPTRTDGTSSKQESKTTIPPTQGIKGCTQSGFTSENKATAKHANNETADTGPKSTNCDRTEQWAKSSQSDQEEQKQSYAKNQTYTKHTSGPSTYAKMHSSDRSTLPSRNIISKNPTE